MDHPGWQDAFSIQLREALRPSVDGWVDEELALAVRWADVEPRAIEASITWWHSDRDRNCPISAAQRLVGSLPTASLRICQDAGHLESYRRAPEILDELLARDG